MHHHIGHVCGPKHNTWTIRPMLITWTRTPLAGLWTLTPLVGLEFGLKTRSYPMDKLLSSITRSWNNELLQANVICKQNVPLTQPPILCHNVHIFGHFSVFFFFFFFEACECDSLPSHICLICLNHTNSIWYRMHTYSTPESSWDVLFWAQQAFQKTRSAV